MLLYDVVSTSQVLSATRSRLAKREALAALLRRVAADDVEVEVVVSYLSGSLRQRKTGVGWSSLKVLPAPAGSPELEVTAVDSELERISRLSGPGSALARTGAVQALFGRATEAEQAFLRGLLLGDVRQGALESAVIEAIAVAANVDLDRVRRAVMVRGSAGPVARAALTEGAAGLERFRLTVGRAVRPMLAATAPDVPAAMATRTGPAVVDQKLDGIRIQAHKAGDVVSLFTRSLDSITARLPEVVAVVRSLPVADIILDGEAMTLDDRGAPRPFQETASRTATRGSPSDEPPRAVVPFFFDCLYVDGRDLLDASLQERTRFLDAIVPPAHRVPRLVTQETDEAVGFYDSAVAAGQEGVVVKSLRAPYDAGRRGSAWVKVKPRHTLDLVVLAVEWGSGRRRGLLSNIHLGARDGDGFVMLGKTFKGMTDEMLAWQTERFQALEVSRTAHVVTVRPEQVVEIAFDGLQRSTRYPGGVALRFARVLAYRDDKSARQADSLDTVRALARPDRNA